MSKTVLGIEIGAENLKLAVLVSNGNQFKISQHKISAVSEKSRDHEDHLNINELKITLEQAVETLKAKKLPVYLSINSSKKIIRTRELPMTALPELNGIVQFEAAQFLPYGIENFYVDYRVIGKVASPLANHSTVNETEASEIPSDVVKVMIVALPKEIVDAHIELVKSCGLSLKSVTVHADAIYQFARHQFLHDGKGIIVCDIGAKSINTILFEGKEFFADITSERGVNDIVDQFAETYSVMKPQAKACLYGECNIELKKRSDDNDALYKKIERLNMYFEDTQEVKSEKPHSKLAALTSAFDEAEDQTIESEASSDDNLSTANAVHDIRKELYNDIYKEINRMIEFYRTRKFGATVDAIYLCGGGASMVGLEEFVKESTDIKQVYASLLKNEVDHRRTSEFNLLISAIGGAVGR